MLGSIKEVSLINNPISAVDIALYWSDIRSYTTKLNTPRQSPIREIQSLTDIESSSCPDWMVMVGDGIVIFSGWLISHKERCNIYYDHDSVTNRGWHVFHHVSYDVSISDICIFTSYSHYPIFLSNLQLKCYVWKITLNKGHQSTL